MERSLPPRPGCSSSLFRAPFSAADPPPRLPPAFLATPRMRVKQPHRVPVMRPPQKVERGATRVAARNARVLSPEPPTDDNEAHASRCAVWHAVNNPT